MALGKRTKRIIAGAVVTPVVAAGAIAGVEVPAHLNAEHAAAAAQTAEHAAEAHTKAVAAHKKAVAKEKADAEAQTEKNEAYELTTYQEAYNLSILDMKNQADASTGVEQSALLSASDLLQGAYGLVTQDYSTYDQAIADLQSRGDTETLQLLQDMHATGTPYHAHGTELSYSVTYNLLQDQLNQLTNTGDPLVTQQTPPASLPLLLGYWDGRVEELDTNGLPYPAATAGPGPLPSQAAIASATFNAGTTLSGLQQTSQKALKATQQAAQDTATTNREYDILQNTLRTMSPANRAEFLSIFDAAKQDMANTDTPETKQNLVDLFSLILYNSQGRPDSIAALTLPPAVYQDFTKHLAIEAAIETGAGKGQRIPLSTFLNGPAPNLTQAAGLALTDGLTTSQARGT